MKIAIASCANLPDWELDDQPFFNTLKQHNIDHQVLAWDSKTDWSQFDACLIRTTWDYQERFPEFTQWLETVSSQTLLLNPIKVVQWNSHKQYLRELEQAGITIAPSEWLMPGQSYDIANLMALRNWTQGFIKPLIGANARECCRFDNSEQGLKIAQAHIDKLIEHEQLVLQPYLKSVEQFGETSGIFFNHQFSHGTRKVPVKGDFRVQDDYGAKDYPYQLSLKEMELAQQAIRYVSEKYGDLLYARIDFLHDHEGNPYLNEMELIEPSLFFRHGGQASCDMLAQSLLNLLKKI